MFGEFWPFCRTKGMGEPIIRDGESAKSLQYRLPVFLFVRLVRIFGLFECLEKTLVLFVKTLRRIWYRWLRILLAQHHQWHHQNQHNERETCPTPHNDSTHRQLARLQVERTTTMYFFLFNLRCRVFRASPLF